MKRRILLFTGAFLLLQIIYGQSPSFSTYTNAVIPGDHADCTITKVGNDFYTTGSSFNPTPVIYHSTDLVHWEAISQPVSATWWNYGDNAGGGCWGGHVVYYKGMWWDYFSRANVMYFVKAKDPKGPWETPVRVNDPSTLPYGLGYDNSIFFDDDNKWYLIVKNGQPNNGIVELGDDGQPTGVVYNLNWLNPSPGYQYSWAEGPVMWKYNGYYYYSFARDVSGGQKVMRSKTLTADKSAWSTPEDFFNVNDTKAGGSLFTSPNHASPAVLLNDSTSWVLHPVYAKDEWKGQGRQGLLNQVRYNASGKPTADYPINASFTAPKLPSSGIPWMVPKSDFFDSGSLNPEWSFTGATAANTVSLSERTGWLRMSAKSSTKANSIVKNDGEHNYSLITRVDFNPKAKADEAGLRIIRGDAAKYAKIFRTLSKEGKKIVSFSFESTRYDSDECPSDTLWLKLVRVNHKISGYYSKEGTHWTKLGKDVDVSNVDNYTDSEKFAVWEGTRQGLYVAGSRNAYFDFYIYRDAYTPILAECPANWFGISKGTLSNGIRTLDNIHPDDWALYAGVEFGNSEYVGLPDSVAFEASSATTGGTVELWADSIDTGNKIGECTITATTGWSDYKTFSAPVKQISGRHDLYLRFKGTEKGKLFQLKWITFKNSTDITTGKNPIRTFDKLTVFPNPAKEQLTITGNPAFNSVEIFNLKGERVFHKELGEKVTNTTLQTGLLNGNYLLKITGNKLESTTKLIIKQ